MVFNFRKHRSFNSAACNFMERGWFIFEFLSEKKNMTQREVIYANDGKEILFA